jgi:hypothetical protein
VDDGVTSAVDGWQVFYLVPVIGICFNIFPVNNSFWFALAFTLYIFMIQVCCLPCRGCCNADACCAQCR